MKPFESQTSSTYEKAPEGQHIAKLIGIIDEGTQRWEYANEEKTGQKIYLQFEVYPEDEKGNVLKTQANEYFTIGEEFTSSLSEKSNLTKLITAWRGKPLGKEDYPFDFSRMLGKFALISVAHRPSADGTKVYANRAGIGPVPRKLSVDSEGKSILHDSGTKCFFFDLDAENWPSMLDIYSSRLWRNIQMKINLSPEYARRNGTAPLSPPTFSSGTTSLAQPKVGSQIGKTANDDFEDDIPF